MIQEYPIKTRVFEGPLELLLTLIEKRKLLINDISLAGRLIEKKSKKFGSFIIKGAQLGAGGAAIATGKQGLALLAIGGPVVLGRFITSPAGRKFFTTGIRTAELAGLEGQFIAGMLRTKREISVKQKRLEKFEIKLKRQAEAPQRARRKREELGRQAILRIR